MMDNGITPVMPIGNGGDFGNNSFVWLFFLIVLLGMGGGYGGFGWGGNNALGNYATQNDMQRGFDEQNNMANQREILAAVNNGTAQTIAASTTNASNAITAIKDGNANIIREFGNVETALTALSGKQQECCSEQKMLTAQTGAEVNANIAQSKYDTSMQLAQMEQRITAKMDANEIQNLRDQVQQLQLANATAGMLRFPNQWTFTGGYFPPISGCPCGGNI